MQLPVSVVITTFNRPRALRKTLESFESANFRCEIIVIDDGSKPAVSSVTNDFPALSIAYYANSQNLGPAQSRNTGILKASNKFIAFTDDDCAVSEDWLLKLYDSISKADGAVAGVGGRVLALGSDMFSRYYEYHKILDPWSFRGQCFYLVTANAIFRRSALIQVGGFDERVRVPGGEDPGLCFKLLNCGYRFRYSPGAIVYHDFRKGFWEFLKTFYRYGRGCAFQSARHFRRFNRDDPSQFFGGLEPEQELSPLQRGAGDSQC